ncbi:MAG: pantoate--beta-alanine ligase [Methylocystis sp.]
MSDVPVVDTVPALRERLKDFRKKGERVALVPTMGALHDGHISLVREARRHAERVVATIFVNPAQFGPSEDFGKYPRTLTADLGKLAGARADLCFAPTLEAMYPPGFSTRVEVDGPARADLDDRFRPTHFCGVATVVAKLLNQAQADVAVFGEKDYQQLLVIQRLARDLDIATEILGAPTLREADGLAMSSRNVYLSKTERAAAPALHRVLKEGARRIGAGEPIEATLAQASAELAEAGFVVDYVEARHARTLARIDGRRDGPPIRLLAAARLGATRLIDNLAVPHDA